MQSSVPEVQNREKVTADRVQLGFSELKNKLEFDRKYLTLKKKKLPSTVWSCFQCDYSNQVLCVSKIISRN